jgi:4a-hydroxytetrahydrobiopterin dehydratase
MSDSENKPADGADTPAAGDAEQTRLTGDALRRQHQKLGGNWKLVDEQRLEKEFKFPDFRRAFQYTSLVGAAAENQGHHPDIYLTYGQVRLQIWTHKANGLTVDDFQLAATINQLDFEDLEGQEVPVTEESGQDEKKKTLTSGTKNPGTRP